MTHLNENKTGHTAHNIHSLWPNSRQWLMIYIPHLIMMIRLSTTNLTKTWHHCLLSEATRQVRSSGCWPDPYNPIRCLIIRSHIVLKSWHWMLKRWYKFAIGWEARSEWKTPNTDYAPSRRCMILCTMWELTRYWIPLCDNKVTWYRQWYIRKIITCIYTAMP